MKTKTLHWLTTAKALPIGKSVRVQCCATKPSMMVSHNDKGFSSHCFKCKISNFEAHKERNISQILEARKVRDFKDEKAVRKPSDTCYEYPIQASAWFLSAGIDFDLAKHYEIGYSPYYNRIVLPVYAPNGSLTTVQLRAVDFPKQFPKYLNPKDVGRTILFQSDDKKLLPSATPPPKTCCIVEDILSAVRVGRLLSCFAVLGTSISAEGLLRIVRQYETVYLWTDDDMGGREGRQKIKKALQSQGVVVHDVITKGDPKELTYEQIKEQIYA